MYSKEIANIAELTQENDHIAAYIASAILLGDKDLESEFVKIHDVMHRLGELPQDLYEKRTSLYRDLKVAAFKKLDEDTYQKWYMST